MDITYYKKYEPIFGSWHIVREIGEGSFGKVFEIERREFGRTYKAALKTITIPQNRSEIDDILCDCMDSESLTGYFRSLVEDLVVEIDLMSQLKGESNIVSYEDHRVVEHEDGIGWDILIRMELLTPLLKYTREHEMTQASVVKLGIDICKALELCEKHRIIHRDIKPGNIFISGNGSFKLGDFGIARTVEKTTGEMSKKGTYIYMAPEVYRGEPYGASVDIYSLGLVLYRLLNNNRAPFLPVTGTLSYTQNEDAIRRRMTGEAIPAPANAGRQLAAVILKACAFDPKDRFSSPGEMREALEKASGTGTYRETSADPMSEDTVSVFSPLTGFDSPDDRQTTEEKTESILGLTDEPADADATESFFTGNAYIGVGGGLCTFGHYKGSSIEWLVLEKRDGMALLLSKYALDCKRFNEEYNDASWEYSTIRWWLNNDFVMEAFNEDERRAICDTELKNDINPKFATNSGEDTTDKVFLLSMEEATKLLPDTRQRCCEPTEYAGKQGAYKDTRTGNCWWWLRTAGFSVYTAAGVWCSGKIDATGTDVDNQDSAVRPAMWIKAEG